MKDEIKEILDSKVSYVFTYKDRNELLDHITTLQERIEYLERSNNRREDEIMSLRDECVNGEIYKSRCEKAIEYLKLFDRDSDMINHSIIRGALNIVQGEDK